MWMLSNMSDRVGGTLNVQVFLKPLKILTWPWGLQQELV